MWKKTVLVLENSSNRLLNNYSFVLKLQIVDKLEFSMSDAALLFGNKVPAAKHNLILVIIYT